MTFCFCGCRQTNRILSPPEALRTTWLGCMTTEIRSVFKASLIICQKTDEQKELLLVEISCMC